VTIQAPAWEKVQWYCKRWGIEEWPRALKKNAVHPAAAPAIDRGPSQPLGGELGRFCRSAAQPYQRK
jgi:hypothetical protein